MRARDGGSGLRASEAHLVCGTAKLPKAPHHLVQDRAAEAVGHAPLLWRIEDPPGAPVETCVVYRVEESGHQPAETGPPESLAGALQAAARLRAAADGVSEHSASCVADEEGGVHTRLRKLARLDRSAIGEDGRWRFCAKDLAAGEAVRLVVEGKNAVGSGPRAALT